VTEELVEVAVQEAVDTEPPTHWERDGVVSGSRSVRFVPRKELRPTYYFEDNQGQEEITAFCARYLKFLEETVTTNGDQKGLPACEELSRGGRRIAELRPCDRCESGSKTP
jgi:hypothetical protein